MRGFVVAPPVYPRRGPQCTGSPPRKKEAPLPPYGPSSFSREMQPKRGVGFGLGRPNTDLHSAKYVAGREYQVTRQQNHEAAMDVGNRNLCVVNDDGDDGNDDGDNERDYLGR